MEVAAHYIDLADGREFVAGIAALDEAARASGVLVTSGVGTLPALSSAVIDATVIDAHVAHFARLDTIDIGIAPGQCTPRGLAMWQAVLSYCGKPLEVWQDGRWRIAHGWQAAHRFCYPASARAGWLACSNVADPALFLARYRGLQRARFDAGLELLLAQAAFWL